MPTAPPRIGGRRAIGVEAWARATNAVQMPAGGACLCIDVRATPVWASTSDEMSEKEATVGIGMPKLAMTALGGDRLRDEVQADRNLAGVAPQ